jgi:hypothetical protein
MATYHSEYPDPSEAEFQRWNIPLTSAFRFAELCARGDLNRARPTLVMPDSANLSVKELPLTPISSSWSAARATRCGTVSILTSRPTHRSPDGHQPTHVVRPAV